MVSQQLARLRLESLVYTRRQGRLVYYSIGNVSVLAFLESLFDLFPAAENS
ncbi:DNA-binding transcriptional ArsR family regulator [Rhizobium laguerreae]